MAQPLIVARLLAKTRGRGGRVGKGTGQVVLKRQFAALVAAVSALVVLAFPAGVAPAAAADFKVDGERLYVSGAIYGRHEFETLSRLVRDNPKVSIVVMKDFYGGTAGTAGF